MKKNKHKNLNDVLNELVEIKGNTPYVSYSQYWKAVDKAIKKENKEFAKLNKKLEITNEMLNIRFTI